MSKKLLVKLGSFLSLCLAVTPLLANTTNRYMTWSGINFAGTFYPEGKWHYVVVNQVRTTDNRSGFEQYVFRPSIYYQLTSEWTFWLGYDVIPTIPVEHLKVIIEQRIWPQMEYTNELSKHLALSLRTRLENRWLENRAGNAVRLRQRLELSITQWNRFHIGFDVFDEVFFGITRTDWVPNQTVDQNRVFLGFVIPFNKKLDLEVGYLNIFLPRVPNNRIDHVLLISFSLDLRGHQSIPVLGAD